jgi:hypothetical protein
MTALLVFCSFVAYYQVKTICFINSHLLIPKKKEKQKFTIRMHPCSELYYITVMRKFLGFSIMTPYYLMVRESNSVINYEVNEFIDYKDAYDTANKLSHEATTNNRGKYSQINNNNSSIFFER